MKELNKRHIELTTPVGASGHGGGGGGEGFGRGGGGGLSILQEPYCIQSCIQFRVFHLFSPGNIELTKICGG